VTIEIDLPHLLPQLMAGLRAGGCSAEPISSRACRVLYAQGIDRNAALCELRFYVRAWAMQHGDVGVSVWPDHSPLVR
jgi:hypothetical protein